MRKYVKAKLVDLLLWLLEKKSYHRVNELEVARMFRFMANSPELRKLPRYFDQCSEAYKNRFLYSQDPYFKGMIMVSVLMREKLNNIKKEEKEKEKEIEKKGKEDKKRRIHKKSVNY
jgi:hypothetical protein